MPALLNPTELEVLQRKVLGATRERMLREMAEALEVLTAEHALILRLEDLHWSDYSTLDLIASLARRPAPARLLLLGTYRSVDVIVREHPLKTVKQELELHEHCEELALELLPEGAVREYLAVRFPLLPSSLAGKGQDGGEKRNDGPQRLARLIHQRTEGNPLFMVAVTDAVVAQGVLVEREGQWELRAEIEEVERRIPPSLRHFIEQLLGRLSPEEQQMLEAASVAGVDFSAATVAAGLEEPMEGVEKRCAGLARREQFLRLRGTEEWPDGTAAARYSFLHALYHEVVYDRVTAGQCIGLHRRVGERQEAAYGTRAGEVAAELAVHFERGRDYRKAIPYLQQAGQNAIRRSAHQEAITLLTKGIELLKHLPETPERGQQELTLQLALHDALLPVKGYSAPEVGKAATRARALCQQLGETPQLFPALYGLTEFYLNRGELQTTYELAEQQMRLAQRVHDPYPLSVAHLALGATLSWLGELPSARTHVERALALYDPQQHPRPTGTTADPGLEYPTLERAPWLSYRWASNTADPRIECLAYLAGWTLWHLGYPDQAVKRSQEVLALAQELSHPLSRAYALGIAAWCHQLRREGQLARERAEALMTLSTEQGFPYWVAFGMMVRGGALAAQGQAEEGIAQVRQGLAVWRSTGAEIALPYWLALLAEAYGKAGQAEEGLRALAEALAMVDKNRERYYEAELYRLKGMLTLQQANQKAKIKNRDQPPTPNPQHPGGGRAGGGGVFSQGHRNCPAATGKVTRAAGLNHPGPIVATTGPEGASPEIVGGDLRLVH